MLASLVNAHVHCCLEKKKKQAILMVTNRAKLKKKYSTMAYSTALIEWGMSMGPSFKGCPWYIVILLSAKKHAVKEGKSSNCWMLCIYDLIPEWSCRVSLLVFINTHTCTRAYIWMYVCTCMHSYMYTHIHMNVNINIYIGFYVKIYKLHIYKFNTSFNPRFKIVERFRK